jgi:hypothetical protein
MIERHQENSVSPSITPGGSDLIGLLVRDGQSENDPSQGTDSINEIFRHYVRPFHFGHASEPWCQI